MNKERLKTQKAEDYGSYELLTYDLFEGYAAEQLDEELSYKPEYQEFDSRWGHWKFLFRPHYDPGVE
jgi:hypothetical protein